MTWWLNNNITWWRQTSMWILDSGPVFPLPSCTVIQETAVLMESALEGCCGGESDAFPSKVQGSTFPWWRVRASTPAARMAAQGLTWRSKTLGFVKLAPGLPFLPGNYFRAHGTELLVKCLGLPREERERRPERVSVQPRCPWEAGSLLSANLPLLQKSPLCRCGPQASLSSRSCSQGRVQHRSGLGSSPEVSSGIADLLCLPCSVTLS